MTLKKEPELIRVAFKELLLNTDEITLDIIR
jgi:hypothetical protein